MALANRCFVTETSAAHLDHFYPAIEAFCRAIADLQDHSIQNAPQVLLDRLGNFLDRIQATAHRPGQPLLPPLRAQVLLT